MDNLEPFHRELERRSGVKVDRAKMARIAQQKEKGRQEKARKKAVKETQLDLFAMSPDEARLHLERLRREHDRRIEY